MMSIRKRNTGMSALVLGVAFSLLAICPQPARAVTLFVNQASGLDTRTCVEARQPGMPVKTISRAINCTADGDEVVVGPGLYTETVDVRRPNTTLRSVPKFAATIDPPSAQGILIQGLSGVTVEGFVVKGASSGISFRRDGAVGADFGVARGNVIYSSINGISVVDCSNVEVEGNIVQLNSGKGIEYAGGTNGKIHNNLVYLNGELGILVQVDPGSFHSVESNTVDTNNVGLRVESRTGSPVGGGDVVNNIVTNNNFVGIHIRNVADMYEDYNNADANGPSSSPVDFDFSGSSQRNAGSHSTSLLPRFVNPPGADGISGGPNWPDDSYHLAQIAAGQTVNSPLIDIGALGRSGDPVEVSGSTASDGFPDGILPDSADMGFHYLSGVGVETPMIVNLISVMTSLNEKRGTIVAGYKIKGTFQLAAGNNGINPVQERVRVEINTFSQNLMVGTCDAKPGQGGFSLCKSKSPGVISLKIVPGNRTFEMQIKDVAIAQPGPTNPLSPLLRFRLFIGNDVGSTEIYYTNGTLIAP